MSTLLFSLNKNKIRKSKTLVNRKFFPQKRNILSKKVSKAKILAWIVFFFFFKYKYNYPDKSSALKRGFTKRTVSHQFYLISWKKKHDRPNTYESTRTTFVQPLLSKIGIKSCNLNQQRKPCATEIVQWWTNKSSNLYELIDYRNQHPHPFTPIH